MLFGLLILTAGFAFAALIMSGLALMRSGDAEAAARQLGNSGAAAPGNPAPVAPSADSDRRRSADPDQLEPSADYRIAYQGQQLRMQSNCSRLAVDLDEPRVTVDTGADVAYYACAGTGLSLTFADGVRVSPAALANASPRECVESIRASAGSSTVVPIPDLTLCAVTSRADAEKQRITQKIVLFHVDAIAPDNTLTVSVTAWNVPL